MGGVLIIISIVDPHAAVGRPALSLRLGGAAGAGRLRAHRLLDDYSKLMKRRNLGITGAAEDAAAGRAGAGDRGDPAAACSRTGRLFAEHQRAVLQAVSSRSCRFHPLLHNPFTYPLGVLPFLLLRGLRHGRLVERREPDRRPGRPGDRPDGDRLGRADDSGLLPAATRSWPNICRSRAIRARRS